MKKWLFSLVIIAMFAWAVYDFVYEEKDAAEPEKVAADKADKEVNAAQKETDKQDDTVGVLRGNIAPDFELNTLDGKQVKLSDYRGKRVMLNFWASWCGPCRAEMPDLQKFYEEKDVVVLAVNLYDTETNKDKVPEFVEEYELTFPILLDEEGKVSELYRIYPIPTSYLIDSNGRIHNIAFGALNYELMIQEFETMQ